MSQNSAFDPTFGPTVLVGTSVVQAPATNGVLVGSYRVRCLVTGYLSWASSQGGNPAGTAPTIPAPVAPSAGTPSPNTVGMTAGTVEVFKLPVNAFLLASVAAAFEVTPGEVI
jgi:hypothetical protein